MKTDKLIFGLIVVMALVSCSPYGYVVTNDDIKLEGRINFPFFTSQDNFILGVYRKNIKVKEKDKRYRLNVKDIKYAVIISSKKKDSILYKSLSLPSGTVLGQQIKKKGNASIYMCIWVVDGSSQDDPYFYYFEYFLNSNNNIMELNPLVVHDTLHVLPKGETYRTRKEQRAMAKSKRSTNGDKILSFINKRYNQHFTYNDFNHISNLLEKYDSMFDYILDKEAEREENNK
jgi:hypothetical protein